MNVGLENLGTVNKNRVDIGKITIWFSYETPVAIRDNEGCFYCRENDWSVTTGKFLNELEPEKENRISSEEFEKVLLKVFAQIQIKGEK